MTVTETVKETVKGALSPSDEPRKSEPMWTQYHSMNNGEAQEPIADWIYPLFIAARATREQMSEAKLPLAYRDSCAHLLIPLNRCRFEEYYMPWKCVDERHSYEKCQYVEFKKRVAKMDELRASKGGARSN